MKSAFLQPRPIRASRIKRGPPYPRGKSATRPAWRISASASGGRTLIQDLQLAKLRGLLTSIHPVNRFYAAKLSPLSAHLQPQSLEEFSDRFPFTLKQDLVSDQLAHPPYGTNLTYPPQLYTRCHQTSGSTGEPLRWLDTPQSWQGILQNWREIFLAASVAPEDRFLFAFSFGPFIGFWSAMESALQQGNFCLAGGSMTSQARLKAIQAHGITVLCCTPTYALHLGELALQEGLDEARNSVRLILVAGEPGGSIPATRGRLAECWPKARVFDHYGMTEVGPATYECPAEPSVLHVIESAYLPEVVHPESGQAVSSGPGELVLTTLDRIGSPVLRYRTGDIVRARPHGRCRCGRNELALEGGILGRCDDMVVVRGVNVFPSAVEEIVRGCGGVAEYRAHLDCRGSLPELSLEVEPATDATDLWSLTRRLEQAFQDRLALRVPVKIVGPATLPRFEMKSKRWVKLVH